MLRLLFSLFVAALGANVTYDGRSLKIDGSRKLLIGGCIHYPRSTPQMWPSLLQQAKDGGVDMIETYVFWNVHEPTQGKYDFTGRLDLVKFLQTAQQKGLWVNLRIGPYVCAEWNYGGFPEWLKEIPSIVFRTYNQPYLDQMSAWMTYLVNLLKANNLFASQGGPIILAQVENEYGNVESSYGDDGKKYVQWCGTFAEGLNIGVPWIMCQQGDAPQPIINTCNGFYCDGFVPNNANSPVIWTENWPGWFQDWGDSFPRRPVEDIAFAVARFFARGGSVAVYYMYHGGTNFGRTSGGPWIVTSYDYDVALDEYGLTHEPKYSHSKHLHAVLHQYTDIILGQAVPQPQNLGTNLEAHIYGTLNTVNCLVFISNIGTTDGQVTFNGRSFTIPAWSVSLLAQGQTVVFNTAQVNAVTSVLGFSSLNSENSQLQGTENLAWSWASFSETVGAWSGSTPIKTDRPLEQIVTTHDTTDYLWYERVYTSTTSGTYQLALSNVQDFVSIFVNNNYVSSSRGGSITVNVQINSGDNKIQILVLTQGLINYGTFFETYTRGLMGTVKLNGVDITSGGWTHTVGLQGENLQIYQASGASKVTWNNTYAVNRPLTWYKATFDVPADIYSSANPLALDLSSLKKGFVWVNGYNLGRYYPSAVAGGECASCDYRGTYNPDKCREGCGKPSQTIYHVPREYLTQTANLIVLFEELGSDPAGVNLVTRELNVICGNVGEDYPADDLKIDLMCGDGQTIKTINFASFGTPTGMCREYQQTSCHAANSTQVASSLCVNKNSCAIPVSLNTFGDPCPNQTKRLAVQVQCG